MRTHDGQTSQVFRIHQDTGVIQLSTQQKLRHIYDVKQYRLRVTATEERSNLASTTDVSLDGLYNKTVVLACCTLYIGGIMI